MRSPGNLKSIVWHFPTSLTTPIDEMRSVGGMEINASRKSSSYPLKSLYMLSLPDMNGVPYATAKSKQARDASLSWPNLSGLSESHQQKLSRIASLSRLPPTHLALR